MSRECRPRLSIRLRDYAFSSLVAIFLACPAAAQCIVTCYGTNPAASITNFSGFWDFMMCYWTFTWTETYTWDCTNNGCTSACGICEMTGVWRYNMGWDSVADASSMGVVASCGDGNTDTYTSTFITNLSNTSYRIILYTHCPGPGDTCSDSSAYSSSAFKDFTTGAAPGC